MNQQIAKQWVAALRSGKYKQGRLRLRTTDDTYCCLGVLCDISNLGEWNENNWYLNMDSHLPKKVMNWGDIKFSTGAIITSKEYISLTDLNDAGKTFKEIADIIEQHWKEM